mmetsp:Transcript_90434/g.281554  ORF Transcript_90434/g.281554 Transcript_90434/m.281554 type:complete len:381 (-) Transcript_90434:130-1272(-)
MAGDLRSRIVRRVSFPDVDVINCHAFSADEQLLAICPNTEDILIYQLQGDEFQRQSVLSKHTQRVTGLAWSSSGRLASCAEDRTAYVWEWDATAGSWRSVVAELRAPRAALCLAWAPDGQRFAVGLASRDLGICYYEREASCWVALKIGKSKAAVGTIAWHPSSQFIASGSTDRHCMVYDVNENLMNPLKSGFGKVEVSEDAGSWVNSVAFSPKGQFLAFFGQDATVRVKDLVGGPGNAASVIRWSGLPLLQGAFITERCLVGCGFDCAPVLFRKGDGGWEVCGVLAPEAEVGTPMAERGSAAFNSARNLFRGSTSGSLGAGAGAGGAGGGGSPKAAAAAPGWFSGAITSCSLLNAAAGRFSMSALDGQVAVCEVLSARA